MRRAKPISVVVKAPSRGLVTRLPGETADFLPPSGGLIPVSLFLPQTMQRAASAASNVRYEDGVVCCAAGWEKVLLEVSLLEGLVANWRLDEVGGSRLDSSGNAHTLLETPGFDSVLAAVLHVTSEPGFYGLAGVFPALVFIAADSDSLTLGVSLTGGAMNPIPVYPEDDLTLDVTLSSGVYLQNSIIPPLEPDSLLLTATLGSGSYS